LCQMSAHNQNYAAVTFYGCQRCGNFDLQGVLLRSYHYPSWLDRIKTGIGSSLLIAIADAGSSVIGVSCCLLLRYIVVAIYIVSRNDLTVIYSQRQITVVEAIQATSGVGGAKNRSVRISYQLEGSIGAAGRFAKTNTQARTIKRILQIQQLCGVGGRSLAIIIYQDRELVQRFAGR